eukprot:TRINITY_DN21240_c0_g1_i1.p1 TRINITY_DN21240_c0_g1~~TRINITY_DN21240_c0_g1_i1.p1  ORF type:complete len:201 (-),score=34.78 TRINITY_DN21240_c0_g1_i1:239-763(-)
MSISVCLLSGDVVEGDFADAATVLDVKQRAASSMDCEATSLKVAVSGSGPDQDILSDEQKLEELTTKSLVVIRQTLDTSLLELNTTRHSEYDDGQVDFYISSTLLYDGKPVWRKSDHHACHIGGFAGLDHKVRLSDDKLTLLLTCGKLQHGGGVSWGVEQAFSVVDLEPLSTQL